MATSSDVDRAEITTEFDGKKWHSQVERAFKAWADAPADAQNSLLLSGPVLIWAEGWMLTHPEQVGPDRKQYILRGLGEQSRKNAALRVAFSDDAVPRGGRMNRLVMAVAFFAAVGLSGSLVKDAVQRASLARASPGEDVQADVSSFPPALRPMTAEANDAVALPGILVQPALASKAVALSERDANAERQRGLDGTRKLAALSREFAGQGDRRFAVWLALEAMAETEARAGVVAGATESTEGTTSLFAALVTRKRLLSRGDGLAKSSTPVFCNGARGVVASINGDRLRAWDLGGDAQPATLSTKSALWRSAAVSRDCDLVMSRTDDYGLEIVSLRRGRPLAKLMGHQADVVGNAFHPTLATAVSASRDSTARLWDVDAGRLKAELRGHDDSLAGADFSPDGQRILTWSDDKTARLWASDTGRLQVILDGHQGALTGAMFTPDSRVVLTTSNDGFVKLWDATTGLCLATLKSETSSIISASFSADGRRIATLLLDSSVVLWDRETRSQISELKDPSASIVSVKLSPDSRWAITTSWSGKAVLWYETGRKVAELNQVEAAAAAVSFSNDGQHLFVLVQDGSMLTWPIFPSLEETVAHAVSTAGPCLSSDERTTFNMRGPAPAACRRTADATPAR